MAIKITELDIASGANPEAVNVVADVNGSVKRVNAADLLAAINTALTNQSRSIDALSQTLSDGFIVDMEQDASGNITVTFSDGSTATMAAGGGGGVGFSGVEMDDNGYLHFYDDEGVDVIDAVFIGSGGSGGSGTGSKLTVSSYTAPTFSTNATAGTAPIRLKIASVDADTGTATGACNLAVYVSDTLRTNLTVDQGDVTIDPFLYLTTGTNTVKLVITDSYGSTATRSFTITLETFSIDWSLAPVEKNTESALSFYVTPVGSGSKTIYTYVDGTLYATDTVATSGRRLTKSITGLTHGAHTIEVYGTMSVDGTTLESDHLVSAVAQVYATSTDVVIAVNWPSGNLTQYTTSQIGYMVIDPVNNPATVKRTVNSVVQATESLDQSVHTWSYRPSASGTVTLGILCGETLISHTYTVNSIGEDVEEVTDGLAIKVDPASMVSLQNWSYGNYSFNLSENFDEVNGGLTTDENGVHCIRITAGDRLTLNYPLFGGDARRTGKAAKLIYAVKNSSAKSTTVISCVADGIGLTVRANDVTLSGNQTSVNLSTCEDEKTELDLNIESDSEDRLIKLMEACSTFTIKQYAANESFTHSTTKGITFGSDDADVYLYLFRAYERDLTDSEVKVNYIADGADGADILARKTRNDIYDSAGKIDLDAAVARNPNAHFIVINADRMTAGKSDAVQCTLRHRYSAGGTEHQWTASGSMKIQGTSSVSYAPYAGPNINFTLDGITLDDGTVYTDGYAMNGRSSSVPTNLVTFKKNVASQDHIVNSMVSEWYNRYQPYVREARVEDPRVRDCMESVMCVVLFHNTSSAAVQVGPDLVQPDETIFFGLGNLCSNKDSFETFQYDDIVIEVKNNTEPQVRFKSNDLSGDNFDNNYEFRYLDESKYSEAEAKALWKSEVQDFVYATDYTEATNVALATAVTINGQTFTTDSAAYRKAKWTAEAPNHFVMSTLYHHFNEVHLFLLRDNCGKNMFWSRTDDGRWALIFAWDHDTGARRNNEGYIDIEHPYMIFDTFGTADAYNAADNAVWSNILECNFSALRDDYLRMESAGATDMDAFCNACATRQGYICEALWLEDAEHNAIRVMQNLGTTAYLERATGRLTLHIRKSLIEQKVLVDSYYCSTAATAESASFRGYTPSTWTGVQPSGKVKVTMYTDCYINVLAGSISYQVRANAGEEVELDLTSALNDTEIYFRHAPWIQAFGDLSALYLGECEASKLKRVKALLIGSDVDGYSNTNFTVGSFTNCVKLERLNLGGLVNAAHSLDLSNNLYLQYLYTKGSGITGVTFAKNGRLKEAHLNAVASLAMNGLHLLETLDMESYASLTSLSVESSPAVNSYAISSAAANLTRVRLLDIDWSVTAAAYETLLRLHNIHGIDDDGYETSNGTLTGTVYFSAIGESKFEDIQAKIPSITFTYGDRLEEHTVTFKDDDGTVLNIQKVEHGGSAIDPITAGYISAPTKASDTDYDYTYWKWDTALNYIVDDTVITAMFQQSTRTYSVDFKVNGTVAEHYDVAAHGSASYQGSDPEQQGYIFAGWDAEADDVTSDMVISAVMVYPTLPSAVADMERFDYLYSDDSADSAAYSKAEFAGIILSGQGKTYFAVKDKIKMKLSSDVITDTVIEWALEAFNHFKLADNSGDFAGIVWGMTGLLNSPRSINSTNSNSGGYGSWSINTWLENDLFPSLPPFWRSLIKRVIVKSSKGGTSPDIVEATCRLFHRSHAEVGFDAAAIPYVNEVDAGAENVTFACYTDNNSRIKKYYNGAGSAAYWWLRSPDPQSTTNVRGVYTNGGANSNFASSSHGQSLCFCT